MALINILLIYDLHTLTKRGLSQWLCFGKMLVLNQFPSPQGPATFLHLSLYQKWIDYEGLGPLICMVPF